VHEPLRLQLSTLPQGSSAVDLEIAARELDLATPDAGFVDPVRVALEIHRQDEQLQVRGTASVAIRQVCVRCLHDAAREMTADVSLVARVKAQRDAGAEAPHGLIYHDGEIVDLTGEIRDLLLLEIPLAPVCRPECRGLCSHCGADLNAGPCECGAAGGRDTRWVALQALAAPHAAKSPARKRQTREGQTRAKPTRKKQV
jgi:uncharacterized protein